MRFNKVARQIFFSIAAVQISAVQIQKCIFNKIVCISLGHAM